MEAKRYLFLCAVASWCTTTMAQKRLVVADADYHIPVEGVSVTTNDGVFTTDSLGRFEVPAHTTMLFLTHLNYENRLVKLSEVNDTVFLISNSFNLREVTVLGVGDDKKMKDLNKRLRIAKQEAQMMSANPNQGVNILGLFKAIIPKKWRRKSKEERKKRLETLLEEY